MSYQVIARKYRPQTFAEVIGQEHITRTLQNAVASGRLHHAYLLTGIRGIGKTTLARIFSKMLNCKEPVKVPAPEPCNKCQSCIDITNGTSIDVQEIDGASNTGVDDVREIRERVKFLPSTGKYKIYIIDEVHMLSTAAFNALLKTLEEPPAHVVFIFATTEVHKIPATILSRCQRYDFRRITGQKIVETLKQIAKSEEIDAEDACLEVIAAEAEGSMRDAESLFDQAIAYSGKKLTYESLKGLLGFLDRKQLIAAVRAIVDRDAKTVLGLADELFQNGENLSRFANELLNALHKLIVVKTCKDIPASVKVFDITFLKEMADRVSVEECQQWFNIAFRGAEDIARAKLPKMLLDVMLINMTQVRPVQSVDELLEKVDQLCGKQPLQQTTINAQRAAVQPPQVETNRLSTINHKLSTSAPATGSWADFIDWLRLHKPQVASFLEQSTGGIIKDADLVIKFQNKSFACDRLMEEDRKSFLEKLALDFFKKPLKLKVEFDSATNEVAVENKKKANEELVTKHRGIKEEALKHDVIKEAANIFGAEIKEIKIK